MRILRLHIENFGKLQDLTMELPEGFHVIRRDNGWGKSTLAAFIKAMFYGLPCTSRRSLKENDRKHYAPWQGGAFGGSMEFQADGRMYRVERFFGKKDREDTFMLYDLQTGLVSTDYSACLGEELFHVDRAAYERSVFLGQHDFHVSLNDSLNARLVHMEEDAGDMRNYEQALASLEEQMRYYQKTGNRGQIGKLKETQMAVRQELSECRAQEEEAAAWNRRLVSLEESVEAAVLRMKEAERKLHMAQESKQAESRRIQYDLLRKQAEEKREEFQQTAAALAEYTVVPLQEEELDRCREQIHQLDILRQKEQGAARQVQDALGEQGNAEDARDEQSPAGVFYGVLTGLFLVLGGFCLVTGFSVPGLILCGISLAALVLGILKHRRLCEEKEYLEARIQEAGRQVREAERTLRDLQKRQDALKKKICEFLSLPKHAGLTEMEDSWRQEQKKSRRYRELKQRYETERKEASRSRELWFRYGEGFSEEEKRMLLASPGSESDVTVQRRALETVRSRLEGLQKEQQDIRYRMKRLQEQAERIPELEEQEAFLYGQITDAVREHALLEQTARYLKMARERFSGRYLGELRRRLGDHLEELEPGQSLQTSVDTGLQMKVQEAGAWRDLECQSSGRQDLLYFAERLAVLDVLYKEEQPPLILDDPFTNLDTARQQRAMELLRQLADDRQILYFTCHDGDN